MSKKRKIAFFHNGEHLKTIEIKKKIVFPDPITNDEWIAKLLELLLREKVKWTSNDAA